MMTTHPAHTRVLRKVWKTIEERPYQTLRQLAKLTGYAVSTVHRAIVELEECEKVTRAAGKKQSTLHAEKSFRAEWMGD